MDISTATVEELYRHLLDIRDRFDELKAEGQTILGTDYEQTYGTARNALDKAWQDLESARQVLGLLHSRD